MTNTQSIPLNRLVQSKANVRRTGQTTGLESLMASIAAHGLRQNLNVLPTTGGRFEVIAGGRRLIALKKLARAGTIPADLPVPCLVLTEAENATEISLAENQVREAMHPDDQCGAFQTLLAEGLPVEDIAARFGVTPAVVTQRLRLAAVSPKLRALYRAGETSLAHMMALTLSEDHATQERALAEGGSPGGIRRCLSQDSVRADHRLALFVGLDAYRAAGGTVLDDLFDPSECYLTDPALLTTLANAKLRDAAAVLVAEGWSWVLPQLERDWSTPYRRVHGEEQEDGSVLFTPEQRAQAGVRLTLTHAGAVEVDRGLVRMDDARRLAGTTAENEDARPARPDYPAALVTELTAHQTAAIQLELTRRPALALAVVVHGFLVRHRTTHGLQSCLTLTLKVPELARHVTDTADCPAHQALKDALNAWDMQLPADPARLWDWCLAQPQETLLAVLATYAALSVDTVRGPYPTDDSPAVVHAHALIQALDLSMADHWQPTPAFMGRVSKTVMAAALTEMGQETVAADLAVMKKPAAAAKAAQALAGTGWLPPVLRRREAAAVNDNAPVAPWEDDTAEPEEEAA